MGQNTKILDVAEDAAARAKGVGRDAEVLQDSQVQVTERCVVRSIFQHVSLMIEPASREEDG